ncbi:MAG: 3-deoxy-manno-octulosonate cytidylyltransferase [Acidobacteria bacterium]|nr:3-deoxy-manno-octulosonate cytidylyltransferase [Acidobacteriota bacterium]
MQILGVIPARLGSTRLSRKPLRELCGQPMVGWVYEAARRSALLSEVLVATDSPEILDVCRRNGWNARLTSGKHRSGTERVHEISQAIAAEVYINIQGDEPLTRPEHIDALVTLMSRDKTEVGTLKTACPPAELNNPNVVKVVTDACGRALYFSRATIPFDREGTGDAHCFKHLGFYAYRKPALDRFVALPESNLELTERLEQLRFLENGIAIMVAETPFDTVSVDTEEDLRRAETALSRR